MSDHNMESYLRERTLYLEARVEALEGELEAYRERHREERKKFSELMAERAALAGKNPFDEHTQMWGDEIRGESDG